MTHLCQNILNYWCERPTVYLILCSTTSLLVTDNIFPCSHTLWCAAKSPAASDCWVYCMCSEIQCTLVLLHTVWLHTVYDEFMLSPFHLYQCILSWYSYISIYILCMEIKSILINGSLIDPDNIVSDWNLMYISKNSVTQINNYQYSASSPV